MLNSINPNRLNNAQTALATSLARLSTAQRINSAKDDAAGLAIASAMAAQMGSSSQAMRNVGDGLSLTSTAESALGQAGDMLQRIRELSLQAANGSNSATDRQTIQTEVSQLQQGLGQLLDTTQFNGQTLFDGSFTSQLQTGPNVGDTTALSLPQVSTGTLGVATLDLTTAAGANSAISATDSALGSINSTRADIGAQQSGLNSTLANLSGTYENLAAAKSRITDTDYTQETANLSRNSVQQQSATQALRLYSANQASVLGIINPTRG